MLRRVLRRHPLLMLMLAALALRLALTPLYAYLPNGLLDEGFWKHWMEVIDQHGVLNIFRESDTDYVGYHWILWLLVGIYDVQGGPYTQTTPFLHVLVKLPPIAFDLVLIAVVYRATEHLVATRNDTRTDDARSGVASAAPSSADARPAALNPRPSRLPMLAAAIIAFQPAVLYDSAVWAQTDAAIAAAMLGALLLAEQRRSAWSGAAYALGLMVKPHPIIIGPLLGTKLLRDNGLRAAMRAALAAALVVLAVLGPWLLHGEARRVGEVYGTLFGKDRARLSELAWNIWWPIDQAGDPRPSSPVFAALDALTYERLAFALSAAATLLALAYAWRRRDFAATLIAASYQAFAFYALPIGAHERYLYPFLALLLPVALIHRRWLPLYVAVSATFFANLVTVAPPIKSLADDHVYGTFGVVTACVNTALFGAMTLALATGLRSIAWTGPKETDRRRPFEDQRPAQLDQVDAMSSGDA